MNYKDKNNEDLWRGDRKMLRENANIEFNYML
jgi:hypothetical protein